jgi:hypothetical protein
LRSGALANLRFQPTASLAALASRRLKRVPLGDREPRKESKMKKNVFFKAGILLLSLLLLPGMTGCSSVEPVKLGEIPVYPEAKSGGTISGNFVIDMLKGPLKGYTAEGDYAGQKAYTLPDGTPVFDVKDFFESELSKSDWKQAADFPSDEFKYPFVTPFNCLAYKRQSQVLLICFPSRPPYGEYSVYLFNKK